MKPEQIAKLREWCNSDSYDPPDADDILAALDEREALLGALHAVKLGGEGGHWDEAACPGCGEPEKHSDGCVLAAAIAKAES